MSKLFYYLLIGKLNLKRIFILKKQFCSNVCGNELIKSYIVLNIYPWPIVKEKIKFCESFLNVCFCKNISDHM